MDRQTDITNTFRIFFHGKFIPLQGVPYIIHAAKILEKHKDISFELVGSGQTYDEVLALIHDLNLTSIRLHGKVLLHEVPRYIAPTDVCLGIFGNTEKTQRVIPNKVYEYIAMKKAVITSNTPAIRELFTDRENILLCRHADPHDLAMKILELKNNEVLRRTITLGGYKLYLEHATPKAIGRNLLISFKTHNYI